MYPVILRFASAIPARNTSLANQQENYLMHRNAIVNPVKTLFVCSEEYAIWGGSIRVGDIDVR
jgi:hypothetical protein